LLDKPSPTPIWDKFLSEILDSESIILLQEVMGYVISNDTLAKKLFILFGTTNTGKSVILEIIKSIIGAKYISSVPLQQICNPDNKFATYSLWGKVANTCGDIPQASLGDTGVLKQCTGEDMMQFERKHGDPFSDYCTARLIFSCNSMPASYNDRTSSFYNRLQIIKFNKTIPKCDQDKFLSSKLKTELNAIAYWAIQGYIRLLQNNYIFSTSKQSIEAIGKYECDNNPALGFFKEHLEFGTDFEMHSLKAYKQYEIWQNQNGQRPISLNKFVDELRTYALRNDAKIEKCRPYINGKQGMGFSGVHCNSVECDETSIF
jgi:putative DNA primase/helicase